MEDNDCLQVPGYEFWIEIASKRAKQYRVERNVHGPSCYIASEVNQEFAVYVISYEFDNPTRAEFYLNDDWVDRRIFKSDCDGKFRMSHTNLGNGKQKFAFSAINYGEDECDLATIPENLGTIRIELFRVKNVRRVRRQPRRSGKGSSSKHRERGTNLSGVPTMSEKSKTVGFHTISLRPPEAAPVQSEQARTSRSRTVYDSIDYETPWQTIKFFYRPLENLRALGIAPPPAVSGKDTDATELNQPPALPKVDSPKDQKPLLTPSKKIQAETFDLDRPTVIKPREIIVIEDSDPEDHKPIPGVKVERTVTAKRAREIYSEMQPKGNKRLNKNFSPEVIVVDSD